MTSPAPRVIMDNIEIRFATLEEIIPLRNAVIIAGTGRDSPYFPGDEDPLTRHVGAFEEGRCVGCATFMRSEWEGGPAWKMRGMATDPARQRQGIGRALLEFAESALRRETDLGVIWCNARETAVPFYEKAGWRVVSERFLAPGIGWHYRMVHRRTPGD